MQTREEDDVAVVVRDALYERRVEHDGCCIHDPAGAELESGGPSVLPIIESVIKADAEGKCPVLGHLRHDEFPGLLSVMRAYFVVSDRFTLHQNAATFLGAITFGVRLDALDAIDRLVYWDKPLPTSLRSALTKLQSQVTPTEKVIVDKILERHRRKWWQRAT